MTTATQPELFRFDDQDVRLEVLITYLRGRDWTLARTIAADLCLNDRDCRALAAASDGRILSGQRGYKLTREATPDEFQRATAWLESQAKEMATRAQAIRRRWHRSGGRS